MSISIRLCRFEVLSFVPILETSLLCLYVIISTLFGYYGKSGRRQLGSLKWFQAAGGSVPRVLSLKLCESQFSLSR